MSLHIYRAVIEETGLPYQRNHIQYLRLLQIAC